MKEIRIDNTKQEKPIEEKGEDAAAEVEEDKEAFAEETETTSEQDIARMQDELESARSESEAAADMMLRLAAEMDNYKKRVAKERQSLIKYGCQDIVQELLPILDNFERAIESASKSKDFDSFLEGVKMIFKQMNDTLERKGITRINAVGETFDPNIHEAVMQVASDDHPENTVVVELQKGYILHDRVIRPSMVTVSSGSVED
jgi:molecular chaperone GrpE